MGVLIARAIISAANFFQEGATQPLSFREAARESLMRTLDSGTSVNFYTVVEAARPCGETPLGYCVTAEAANAGKLYGVHCNPKKSAMVMFTPEDKVIVIAEE